MTEEEYEAREKELERLISRQEMNCSDIRNWLGREFKKLVKLQDQLKSLYLEKVDAAERERA